MLKKALATWIYDDTVRAYHFEPSDRKPPPYLNQIIVEAIIDVAEDGTLAGVEIIDRKAPPPPNS